MTRAIDVVGRRARTTQYARRREANWRRDHIYLKNGAHLDWNTFEAVRLFQGGGCAICGRNSFWNGLHADHDAKSGVFRGVLCGDCNHYAVGTFERRGKYKSPEHEKIIRDYLAHPPYTRWLTDGATQ